MHTKSFQSKEPQVLDAGMDGRPGVEVADLGMDARARPALGVERELNIEPLSHVRAEGPEGNKLLLVLG